MQKSIQTKYEESDVFVYTYGWLTTIEKMCFELSFYYICL